MYRNERMGLGAGLFLGAILSVPILIFAIAFVFSDAYAWLRTRRPVMRQRFFAPLYRLDPLFNWYIKYKERRYDRKHQLPRPRE